jgi:hypothetical protein
MTSEAELKEIKSLLKKLYQKVEGLSKLVEERLIGCEEPTKEDIAAIKKYDTAKKKGKLTLVPLAIYRKGLST